MLEETGSFSFILLITLLHPQLHQWRVTRHRSRCIAIALWSSGPTLRPAASSAARELDELAAGTRLHCCGTIYSTVAVRQLHSWPRPGAFWALGTAP